MKPRSLREAQVRALVLGLVVGFAIYDAISAMAFLFHT